MRTLILSLALLQAAPSSALAEDSATSAVDIDEAESLYQRGSAEFAEGRTSAAAAHFRAALAIDPSHARARAYLAECLVIEGEVEAARKVASGGSQDAEAPPPMPPDPPGAAPAQPLETSSSIAGVVSGDSIVIPETVEEARAESPVMEREAPDVRTEAARHPDPDAERKARRNPRSQGKISAGLALGGAAVTVGVFAELRPSWFGAFEVGVGGFLVPDEGRGVDGAVALSIEAQLSPIPWRLTPVLGVGVVILAGPAAAATENTLWSLPSNARARAVPYIVLGARYDLHKRLWFSLSARLAPSPTTRVMPMPGARVGLRF